MLIASEASQKPFEHLRLRVAAFLGLVWGFWGKLRIYDLLKLNVIK